MDKVLRFWELSFRRQTIKKSIEDIEKTEQNKVMLLLAKSFDNEVEEKVTVQLTWL